MKVGEAQREMDTTAAPVAERLLYAHPVSAPSVPTMPVPYRPGASALARRYLRNSRGLRLAGRLELEVDRGTAFLFAPVFLAAGAIHYFVRSDEPSTPFLALLALLAAVMTVVLRGHPALRLTAMAAFLFLAGVGLAQFETWRLDTPMMGSTVTTRLTGVVAGIDETAEGRARLTLDVVATARPVLRYAPERVRVTAASLPQNLAIGDTVEGTARLMPPSGPARPGSYDFAYQSYFGGVGASGFFMGRPLRLDTQAAGQGLGKRILTGIASLRQDIARHIRDRVGGPEGAIAAALMVGTRGGIPEPINEAMRRTGIYHVISISGLHMALVAGTMMALIRAGLALFPAWASRHATKKYAAMVALLTTTAYLAISGGEVAAQRSYIMLAVMLVAVLVDRAALTMRNLAISALVVLVIAPHEVMGPSFQMSFAATAALVAAFAWWTERRRDRAAPASLREGRARKALRHVWTMVAALAATSIVAGLATTMFGIWHFQRVAPLSLFANLAIMPVVSVLVMPCALAAALTMPFGLDGPFLAVMGHALRLVIVMAEWFSARSPADSVGTIPLVSVLSMTAALVLVTMLTTGLRLTALPVAMLGLFAMPFAERPVAMVSEDARLVAVRASDTEIAVNRPRAGRFLIESWRHAFGAETVLRPATKSGVDNDADPKAFRCASGLCLAKTGHATIAYAETFAAAAGQCGSATVLILDDATQRPACAGTLLITKRDLARRGSAAITLSDDGGRPAAEATYAIEEPYRRWHAARAFSREARGLPPYERRDKPSADAINNGE